MTNEERFERIEKEIINLRKNYYSELDRGFKALKVEWEVYENEYKNYLKKKRRIKEFLWWLCRKITFRSTKLTRKEVTKRTAKRMAHIFYKGDR